MTSRIPHRTFRCEDDLWKPAMEKAEEQGTTLSAILRERLEELVGAE